MKFLLVVSSILAITVFCMTAANADCVHVWRPGMVTYVEAGQPIHFLVEQEDVDAYAKQTTNVVPMAQFPPKEGFGRAMDDIENSHYCGEYREITDEDLDNEVLHAAR